VGAVTPNQAIRRYLQQLAFAAQETSGDLRLLPLFVGILKLVPETVSELERAERLAA
jgi:hypothetical protein